MADAKVNVISATTTTIIINMGIEMIMVKVFKRGAIIGTDIDVVNIVDGIIPTLLDFPLLGCAILALLLASSPSLLEDVSED